MKTTAGQRPADEAPRREAPNLPLPLPLGVPANRKGMPMELRLEARDKRLGMTLAEVRNFVEMTEGWPGETDMDCMIPGRDKPLDAALMGLYAGADIKCPRCGRDLPGAQVMHPISRVDNKTRICNGCGRDEAMWDMHHGHLDMPPVTEPCQW